MLEFDFSLSFEFFPPKTPKGQENLNAQARQLAQLSPNFFSITYGAGGSTRDNTLTTANEVAQHTQVPIAPHLAGIGLTQSEVRALLNQYRQQGFNRLVTIRGDVPEHQLAKGDFNHAIELIELIRANDCFDQFYLEVAAYPEVHPQAINPKQDFAHFLDKVKAGANGAITQYFYNIDSYYYFLEKCASAQVNIPVIPGIMPIYDFKRLENFSNRCGAEIPLWLKKHLEYWANDPPSLRAFGIDVVTQLCDTLQKAEVPGLHFYTLNKADICLEVCKNLGFERDQQTQKRLSN